MTDNRHAYAIEFDSETQVLHVRHTGFMSFQVYDRYRSDFIGHLRQSRRHAPAARVLIDTIDMGVLPAEVASRLDEVRHWFGPDDRVAIVVESSLLRLQLRRISDGSGAQSFATEGEARDWLTAQHAEADTVPV